MMIVSACLLGVRCRYDGTSRPDERVIGLCAQGKMIPVCPEQLGGLPTPRLPAEQKDGKVVRKDGSDVTSFYEAGAREALRIAKACGCGEAILKSRSPACGCGLIYDGTFTKTLIAGDGIMARMLKENGIEIRTEEDI